MDHITKENCEAFRKKIYERLNRGEVRFERLETKLDTLISTNKLIAGAVIGGMVSIVITLLLRGI